jgi:hypothetical protein
MFRNQVLIPPQNLIGTSAKYFSEEAGLKFFSFLPISDSGHETAPGRKLPGACIVYVETGYVD